jgi:hypothetical protein
MLFMSWVCTLPCEALIADGWQYTPREIAFRIGFYHSCQSIGNMVRDALLITVSSPG